MGNIRIKDIATTAASTASDDFIAIDGATNGTRKLSAYSPTIGGNLLLGTTTDSSNGRLQLATHNTIAGGIGFGTDASLIRAGAGSLQILSGSTTGAKLTLYAPDATSANTLSWAHPGSRFWDLGTVAGSVATLKLAVTSASSATFSIDPNVSIAATTASTSTTTGALVVSGGVGVAGDVNVGGVIIHKSYTVAGLPAAAAGNTYGIVFVSDATNAAGTGIGTAPTGGGAVKRAVYSTGSAWLLL
jgi:hypothetical protein